MTRIWKTKGTPQERQMLFCPNCKKCMHTKDDVKSRNEHGLCERCATEINADEYQHEVVTIVIGEGN